MLADAGAPTIRGGCVGRVRGGCVGWDRISRRTMLAGSTPIVRDPPGTGADPCGWNSNHARVAAAAAASPTSVPHGGNGDGDRRTARRDPWTARWEDGEAGYTDGESGSTDGATGGQRGGMDGESGIRDPRTAQREDGEEEEWESALEVDDGEGRSTTVRGGGISWCLGSEGRRSVL
nr:unnamed protein product [Digitaria exilis]